jgi:glycosyltransferase involved in cell wall biosynthesis
MRARRVLFLTGRLLGGGSENVLLRHTLAMDRNRFEPEIFALEPHAGRLEAYRRAGIRVDWLPSYGSGPLRVAMYRERLARRCATGEVDLVHAFITDTAVFGPQAARSGGPVPVVVSQRNLGHWLGPVQRALYRLSNRWFVDRMIVNSHAVREQVARDGLCPPGKIVVVHNGVDLDAFRPRDRRRARARLGLDPDRVTVGIVGRLRALKGQRDLLRAAGLLGRRGYDLQVVLAGGGPERAELESLCRKTPCMPPARFLGRRDDVESVYPALDVCVLCSRTEGFPNVALEAMACGCAIVSTPVGGTVEAVREGREGLFYPVGDAEALAARLAELLDSSSLREELGRQARRRAESRFGFDAMQRSMEEVYESVLDSPARNAA